MAELEAYWIPTRSGNSCHCYLKNEVDKVLAEKDAEIRRLKHALLLARTVEGVVSNMEESCKQVPSQGGGV